MKIALIAGEEDAKTLAIALEEHSESFCSPVSVWEAVAGLCRSYDIKPDDARRRVQLFLGIVGLSLVPIGEAEAQAELEAYARYGRGRHRASLNMGDYFAYACAKLNSARLLYKGDHFIYTDLA